MHDCRELFHFEDQCKNAGAAIRRLRTQKGMSMVDLADVVSDGCYADVLRVESGQTRLPYSLVPLWAEALGISAGTLARHLVVHYDPELGKVLYGFGLYPELHRKQSTAVPPNYNASNAKKLKKMAVPRQAWVRHASAQG